MPVFISYQRNDEDKAKEIYSLFISENILCYLDLLDPTTHSTSDITRTLLSGLKKCSHLLAIISFSTQDSWWVPFEIGAGTESEKRITTFRVNLVNLPDYLSKWPILSNDSDLRRYIEIYKRDESIELTESSQGKSIHSATEFHRSLKNDLGQ